MHRAQIVANSTRASYLEHVTGFLSWNLNRFIYIYFFNIKMFRKAASQENVCLPVLNSHLSFRSVSGASNGELFKRAAVSLHLVHNEHLKHTYTVRSPAGGALEHCTHIKGSMGEYKNFRVLV